MSSLLPGPTAGDLPDRVLGYPVGRRERTRRFAGGVASAYLADRLPVETRVPVIFSRDHSLRVGHRTMSCPASSSAKLVPQAHALSVVAGVKVFWPYTQMIAAALQNECSFGDRCDAFLVHPAVRLAVHPEIRETAVALADGASPQPALGGTVSFRPQQVEQSAHRPPSYCSGRQRVVKPPEQVFRCRTTVLNLNLISGGASGIRTPDPLPARQVLSR